ncbi:unnamed protein product [Citrullus colocynthis]|uniref:Uncharacterized protein n=1 Tax=Citrullus colocynthis TaxID=252529 RepID=A0ABP0Z9W3_9ROSI
MFENIREESRNNVAQHVEHMLENIHDKSHSFVVSPTENVSDDDVHLCVLGKKKSKNTLKTLLPYVQVDVSEGDKSSVAKSISDASGLEKDNLVLNKLIRKFRATTGHENQEGINEVGVIMLVRRSCGAHAALPYSAALLRRLFKVVT